MLDVGWVVSPRSGSAVPCHFIPAGLLEWSPRLENRALWTAIYKARSILERVEEPKYTEQAWQNAVGVLAGLASSVKAFEHAEMIVPSIEPGPEGTIDLYWHTPRFELLLNVPRDTRKRPNFFGDEHGLNAIRGPLYLHNPDRRLISWLKKDA